jgi:hypothetical protein
MSIELFIAQVMLGVALLRAHNRACALAKIVPLLPHPDEFAKPAQRSHPCKPRNCLAANDIGEYFD